MTAMHLSFPIVWSHTIVRRLKPRRQPFSPRAAIPQPRGRTGSNAVEAWRWQHCSGEGKFVMSVFDRREARIQEFGDTTAAGLCREADWNFGGPTVGKAEGRITVIGRMG